MKVQFRHFHMKKGSKHSFSAEILVCLREAKNGSSVRLEEKIRLIKGCQRAKEPGKMAASFSFGC